MKKYIQSYQKFFEGYSKDTNSYKDVETFINSIEFENYPVTHDRVRSEIKFPNNVFGQYDEILPYNFLKSPHEVLYLNLQIPLKYNDIIKKYGGDLEDIYSPDGYGSPVFRSKIQFETIRMAYKFVIENNDLYDNSILK